MTPEERAEQIDRKLMTCEVVVGPDETPDEARVRYLADHIRDAEAAVRAEVTALVHDSQQSSRRNAAAAGTELVEWLSRMIADSNWGALQDAMNSGWIASFRDQFSEHDSQPQPDSLKRTDAAVTPDTDLPGEDGSP